MNLDLSYRPETLNSGQNQQLFVLWPEIWQMTLKNNRAPLLGCFDLCASFHSHQWNETQVTIQKRSIVVAMGDFLSQIWQMAFKNNRAHLPCYFKLCVSFHSHWWIETGVTAQKHPIWVKIDNFLAVWPWNLTGDLEKHWVLTFVTLTFDFWPWPFAWTSLLSLVITLENFMMIQWWKHGKKGVTDGQTDWTIHRAAWSQLKILHIH